MVCVRVSVRKQNKQNEIKEGFLFYREEKDDGFMSIGEGKNEKTRTVGIFFSTYDIHMS